MPTCPKQTPGRRRAVQQGKFATSSYVRRGRVLTPLVPAWKALGTTLAGFGEREGPDLRPVPRSFLFDLLVAYSCREVGAVLVSGNGRDLDCIARVFAFESAAPYPVPQ